MTLRDTNVANAFRTITEDNLLLNVMSRAYIPLLPASSRRS